LCGTQAQASENVAHAKPLVAWHGEWHNIKSLLRSIHIPPNIDAVNPSALLHLFIPYEMLTTISENINLYAIASSAPIAQTLISRRYLWPANANEVHAVGLSNQERELDLHHAELLAGAGVGF
jgi:hypothetical protein